MNRLSDVLRFMTGDFSATDTEEIKIERGGFVNYIKVFFDSEGRAMMFDCKPRAKVSPRDEKINHLKTKVTEATAAGHWNEVAEIADALDRLQDNG